MVLVGLVLTLLGFLLSVFSLGITASIGGRLGIVLVGIVVSIAGIGTINRAFLRDAIWKK